MAEKKKKGSYKKKRRSKNTTTAQRSSKKQISSEGIDFIRRQVQLHKCLDLSEYYRLNTFQEMLNNPDIFACYDHRATMLEKSQPRGYFKYNANSEESIKAKNFLEYNMRNLADKQTPRSISRDLITMIKNEWSPFEIVYEKSEGEWAEDPLTQYKLKKLAFIDPLTLDRNEPFKIADGGDKLLYLNQRAEATMGSRGYTGIFSPSSSVSSYTGNKQIMMNRLAIANVGSGGFYPRGDGYFDAAYVAYEEIRLLNEYSVIGVTRDFSGTPVLRLPSQLLEKHANPDQYPHEYKLVESLKESLEMMEAGDQTFMILPSETTAGSTSMLAHDISFKGIDGGGKNYNIESLIELRRKTIYNVFGCQHLLSAESSGVSYNQHQGLENTASHYVHRDMDILEEFWNKQVFSKLLKLNGWKLKESDIPLWVGGSIQEVTLEEQGKYVNRIMRGLPCVPDVVNDLLLKPLNTQYRVPKNTSTEDLRAMLFEFNEPSKVGTGNGSSGTGNSQQGGKDSDTNSENK